MGDGYFSNLNSGDCYIDLACRQILYLHTKFRDDIRDDLGIISGMSLRFSTGKTLLITDGTIMGHIKEKELTRHGT